jgi:hypothetical protein
MYDKDCHPAFKHIASLENAILIDFIFDLATIICFAWAIYKLLSVG